MEIEKRKQGETDLTNSDLISLSMATAIEISKSSEVKALVSERMPDSLKGLFDQKTLAMRSGSNK